MNRTKYIALLILLLVPVLMAAQYLENPSFEGPPGLALSPSGWFPFDPGSTPDTEPLACDNFSASHGKTYLTLVAHGPSSPRPNSFENCQTTLMQPLQKGICYTLSMDLASRNDLGHYTWGEGFIHYRTTVYLKIFGSADPSEKGELLAETAPVTNLKWENSSFTIIPEHEIKYLLLELSFAENGYENGNLQVDNLVLTDYLTKSTVMLTDTFSINDLPIPLEASESKSYSWSPNTGLSCYDCRSPQVISNMSTTYTCTIVSPITGCGIKELFILSFDKPSVLPDDFKIPNVFTPNGDGINDLFTIRGLLPFSTLMIYDRSGRELYTSQNYQGDWDGRDQDGNLLPEDNYWYVLEIPGQSKRFKGSVYLKAN